MKSAEATAGTPPNPDALLEAIRNIRNRIIGGILFVAPLMLTFWVLYKLYSLFADWIINPAARLVVRLARDEHITGALPWHFEYIVAPITGTVVVLLLLYFLGVFAKSRFNRLLNWILLRVPFVTTVYRGIRRVFDSLEDGGTSKERFKRVVLVEYPHPGTRVIGLVTGSRSDSTTGKKLLSVYVPTAPFLSSGLVVLVPEETVTNTDWSIEEALQGIVSWGLAMPPNMRFGVHGVDGLLAKMSGNEESKRETLR